ncbi:MAG: D-alanyl-D-alanine carboxypeptidase [candidate division Zixibacteria bacterium]|nr:D-alanyl-D-alanine carboxypeptidase [candidate division Zixibacteria bacterium]
MLRIISRIILVCLVAATACGFIMVTPADLSIIPGFEGPPPPPELVIPAKPPRLRCRAAILIDNQTAQTLYGRNEYSVRPIASITKLLTALTFLDFKVDWDKEIGMTRADARNSSRSKLRWGDVYKVRYLFCASLLSSDNRATRALARSTGISQDSFTVTMNRKARQLGLLTMRIEEPTGLSEKNVASAIDCARLLNVAAADTTIKRVMQTHTYDFHSVKRQRKYRLTNTNRLLKSRWFVEGGKTGYIFESGWCVAVRMTDWHGIDLTAVVLGARSKSSRFTQAARLFQWGFRELREIKG